MDIIEVFPSLIAVFLSFIAILMLIMLAYEMRGGRTGKVMFLLMLGIFFSVTAHSGFEVVGLLLEVDESVLFPAMATLLVIGSLCFITAGVVGLPAQSDVNKTRLPRK